MAVYQSSNRVVRTSLLLLSVNTDGEIVTFEVLEDVRLFVGQEVRKLRIAAQNSHLNGYHAVGLGLENEAALGEKILRELAQEKTSAR